MATNSESAAAQLRALIAKAKQGRQRGAVPKELRKQAVEYFEAEHARGGSAVEAGAALGLHPTTLVCWQKALAEQPAFAPVVVKNETPTKHKPLMQESRMRVIVVEGTDASAMAELVRGLS